MSVLPASILPAAALAVADLACLLLFGLSPVYLTLGIWQLGVGLGLAAAGGLLTRHGAAVAGPLLLVGGTLMLSAPVLTAVGSTWASGVATVAAGVILVPLGLLAIPARSRAPRLLRALDVTVVVAGGASVAGHAWESSATSLAAGTVVLALVLVAGSLHFELSAGAQRRQVLWLILGASVSTISTALYFFAGGRVATSPVADGLALALLGLLLPLCVVIAVLDPTAVEVRAVTSGTVVAAVMISLTVALVALVSALAATVTDRVPSLGVQGAFVALIAAGFHPVLLRVRAVVDDLLFGSRADPMDTMTRLGTELSAGSSPQEWLHALRTTLGVAAVALRVDGDVVAHSGSALPVHGSSSGENVTELRVGEEHVADLLVALPPDQLRLPASTMAALRLVAGPLAQALQATRLAGELQASRGRVVAALEEERRRVRNDLHDGLGPTLTGIAYTADAAANLLPTDAPAVAGLLRDLRADSAEAIAEIRRIVYGLRPKALDELGLLGAVRSHAARLSAADGRPMCIEVVCANELPALPAAVEVAVYRAAVEAVTNVARHAGVDRAGVEFVISEDVLTLTVTDHGRDDRPWTPGVGLSAMRERVEQVGGRLTVFGGPAGRGVRAVVPISTGPAAGPALP